MFIRSGPNDKVERKKKKTVLSPKLQNVSSIELLLANSFQLNSKIYFYFKFKIDLKPFLLKTKCLKYIFFVLKQNLLCGTFKLPSQIKYLAQR